MLLAVKPAERERERERQREQRRPFEQKEGKACFFIALPSSSFFFLVTSAYFFLRKILEGQKFVENFVGQHVRVGQGAGQRGGVRGDAAVDGGVPRLHHRAQVVLTGKLCCTHRQRLICHPNQYCQRVFSDGLGI